MLSNPIGTRLQAARKAAGFTGIRAFTRLHNLPISSYVQHERGNRTPGDESLKLYSKAFGVTFHWLKTGEGEPYKDKSHSKRMALQQAMTGVDQELLTHILRHVLERHQIKISSKKLDVLTEEAVNLYGDLISLELNSDNLLKMLKTIFAAHDRVNPKEKQKSMAYREPPSKGD